MDTIPIAMPKLPVVSFRQKCLELFRHQEAEQVMYVNRP